MCDDDYPDSYWDIDQWPDEMTRRVPRLSKQDEQRLIESRSKAVEAYQGDDIRAALDTLLPSINIKKPVLSLPRKSINMTVCSKCFETKCHCALYSK